MKPMFSVLLLLLLAALAEARATAPATQPTPKAAERAQSLKDRITSLRLDLTCHGPQDKPYYSLTLSVARVEVLRSSRFELDAQISEAQAGRIIERLTVEAFFDQAIDADGKKIPAPPVPCYTLSVFSGAGADRRELYAVWGWGPSMLKRLDALRGVLEGGAARNMDVLLGRLSGERQEWKNEAAGERR